MERFADAPGVATRTQLALLATAALAAIALAGRVEPTMGFACDDAGRSHVV